MPGMSNRNPAPLPDVAGDAVALARPLDWVGMDHIALPVRIPDGQGGHLQVAADIDVAVDIARAEARGIHMSRLYLQLQDGLAREAITPAGLRHLLQEGIASQQGLAAQARLRIRYDALLQRWAPPHHGSVPGRLHALLVRERLQACADGRSPSSWSRLTLPWRCRVIARG